MNRNLKEIESCELRQEFIRQTKVEKKAFQWYLKLAKGGDSDGQNNLGYYYENGIGTTKCEKKAFRWYLKSTEVGNNKAQNNLDHRYQHGIGTKKDEGKAFKWYLKSAEDGNNEGQNILAEGESNEGQYNLGYCYQHGIGTTKDEGKAFQWYMKSAKGGNITGQYNLGYCYRYEIRTKKDEEEAFQWYLKSAEGGVSNGQNNLGHCYRYGIGTAKDEEEAFQWFLKSAKGGNKIGQGSLEYFYQNEIGISKIKKNKNNENKLMQDVKNNDVKVAVKCFNLLERKSICQNGPVVVDKIIHMSQLDESAKEWEIRRWIDYNKFKNIEYLAEGGFGSVWKAKWIVLPPGRASLLNYSAICQNGPVVVDKIIHMSQLDESAKEWEIRRWIDYNKFKNIEYLAEGGFGSVWKAKWIVLPPGRASLLNYSGLAW
ncbi:hypothetical protein Glove_109g134 [Diversispora epigaea]|uniref:Protein kinase domain-containing protein n=1 Tax=Diversispora epigaea TaxID=1348612 RepID=A0A397J945_9GLOM|nr:hypothetical protein Glove_109g134 [Diversispora epigaea]